jgi:hypothetical protein
MKALQKKSLFVMKALRLDEQQARARWPSSIRIRRLSANRLTH